MIDPLEGIGADHITRAEEDYPDLRVFAGDYVYVQAVTAAEPGVLVVANVDGKYAVRRHDGELEVHGLVVGVFRRLVP